MATIVINDVELEYIEQGKGNPLIFVHGGLSDFRSWGLLMEPFSQHYRVIAYSRRYHYPNTWIGDESDYSVALHTADLAAFIKGLGLAPVHLVTSSYGGCVALPLTVEHPELVRTLVLGEPPLLPWLGKVPGGAALLEAQTQAIASSRQAFESVELEQGVRIFIDSVMGQGVFDHLSPPARSMMLDNAPEMKLEVRTQLEKYFPTLTGEETRQVKTPTLLLTGELSPKMFHLITDELEKCLTNRERAMIPGASHGMHLMNPPAYIATVLAFLAKY